MVVWKLKLERGREPMPHQFRRTLTPSPDHASPDPNNEETRTRTMYTPKIPESDCRTTTTTQYHKDTLKYRKPVLNTERHLCFPWQPVSHRTAQLRIAPW